MGVRGFSFLPLEDEAIAKAWTSASENPITGTEQKSNDFYGTIQQLCNTKYKPANRELRTMESIKTRCRAIHKECMMFSGCYARVLRINPSGASAAELGNMATALYNGMEMRNVGDEFGKPFRYMGAWNILRSHQKFTTACDSSRTNNKERSPQAKSSQNRTVLVSDDADEIQKDTEGGLDNPKRLIGRKRAKKEAEKEAQERKKIKIAARSLVAQEERNMSLMRHYEIMLFTNAPAGCNDEDAVEYCNIMRKRALVSLRSEENGAGSKIEEDESDAGNEGAAGSESVEEA